MMLRVNIAAKADSSTERLSGTLTNSCRQQNGIRYWCQLAESQHATGMLAHT